jgi:molybdate transport system substrate-binding protein
VAGTFNAVGVMRDQLLAGAPCDVVILTAALIQQLEASGHVVAGSARQLGVVKTGVAVKAGAPAPRVDTPEQLKTALLAATGIYFPDPVKATAGIHFMRVLKQLGIDTELAPRLRPFPNGATAMGEMARCDESGLIGCTQVTEILYTPGVSLVAPLPQAFELATVYTAAVSSRADSPQAAAALISLLISPNSAALRAAGGFED